MRRSTTTAVVATETYAPVTAPSSYWHQSRRPLASLLFVLPMLILYEAGMVWLGPGGLRNGADVWLQQFLGAIGIGGNLLLPVVTIAILMAMHHVSGQPWRISLNVLYTMAAECTLFAMALLVVAHLHARVLSLTGVLASCDVAGSMAKMYFGHMVRYFGAGIYEELLFRLILLPVTIALVGVAIASRRWRVAAAVVLTSIVFSAAHYVGPHGESFQIYTFVFRFVAGGFFALLFVFRGFGIAVGTHALYDILVGLPPTG